MNTVLENNGDIAILRRGYVPLSDLKNKLVFSDDIGMLVCVYREDFDMSQEKFLQELPVGGAVN